MLLLIIIIKFYIIILRFTFLHIIIINSNMKIFQLFKFLNWLLVNYVIWSFI